jgi:hypothetical protein
MRTLAEGIYRNASIGSVVKLPKSGSWLENAYVYDASAREIKALAKRGLVQIVSERTADSGDGDLITELVFTKLG